MKEKIAKITVEFAKDHYWDSLTEVKELIIAHIKGMSPELSDQILSLPVEGCDCTLSELPENYKRVKKQNDLLMSWNSHIAKFIRKQKDLPPEFAKLINEHFWELV